MPTISVQSSGCQSAGDVTAAAGEGADGAVGHGAVEAGDHDALALHHGAQSGVGSLLVDRAVDVELDPVSSVHKLETQECCWFSFSY